MGISGVGIIVLREVHCILEGWVDGVILEWKKKKASKSKSDKKKNPINVK